MCALSPSRSIQWHGSVYLQAGNNRAAASDATIRYERERERENMRSRTTLVLYRTRTPANSDEEISRDCGQRYTWRGAVDTLMIDRQAKKVTVMRGVHTRAWFDLTCSRNNIPGTYKLGSCSFVPFSCLCMKTFLRELYTSPRTGQLRLILPSQSRNDSINKAIRLSK